MREYRIQCETDPMPAGQQPIGSAHTPNPVTSSPHDLQGACPLACNGTANNPQSSTVARSHSMELATEPLLPRWVCVLCPARHPLTTRSVISGAHGRQWRRGVIAGSLDDDFLGLFDRRVAIRLILVRRRGAAQDTGDVWFH